MKRWMMHLSLLLCLVGALAYAPHTAQADEPKVADTAPPATPATTAAPAADAPKEEPKSKELIEAEAALAEKQKAVSDDTFRTNNVWMMVATFLVFFMNLGFACVETGLTRSKNTVNILFKNTLVPCIGVLTYALIGFNLMYPGADYAGKWFGFAGFGVGVGGNPEDAIANMTQVYNAGYTYWTDFLFQGMFAATAATIISGAVAERIKMSSFLVFTVIFVAVCYPIPGMWKWGNGWLNNLETPFYDFAGSTLVHSVGGWGALIGIMILGPRIGKYGKDGSVHPIPGHSMPLATIGVFVLWLGWFGFNGGSVLSADPALVSLVLVTTSVAACAGGVASTLTSWTLSGKPDLSMALNGILAGLVAITAGADQMNVMSSTLIGLIAGVIVVLAVFFFDKIKIDDPVGATSVHLVCGVFGTLAVGIFGAKAGMPQLISQIIGIVAVAVFTLVTAGILFLVIKLTMGLRVSAEEEFEGLDLGEHDMSAYPDFQHTYIKSYHAREI